MFGSVNRAVRSIAYRAKNPALTARQLRIAAVCFRMAFTHFRQLFAYLQTQWDPEQLAATTERAKDFRFSSGPLVMSDPWTRWHLDAIARGFDDEAELRELVRLVSRNTMVSYDALTSLARLVRYCEEAGTQGTFVELGVWRGGCLGMMAASNLKYGRSRRDIYGFDSFEGLPQLVAGKDFDGSFEREFAISETSSQGELRPINALTAPQEAAEGLITQDVGYPPERLHLRKGWFQDTLPQAVDGIGPIAVLRFDCDLYESYRFCLPLLWDKVVPGGFVVIDDWCLKGCRDAVNEFLAGRGVNPYLFTVDNTVRVLQKP